LIPDDHVPKQVDKVLDLSWLRSEVADTYSQTMGRPSINHINAAKVIAVYIIAFDDNRLEGTAGKTSYSIALVIIDVISHSSEAKTRKGWIQTHSN